MHPLLLPMSGASGIVMSYFKPKAETLQRLAARKRMREQDDEDEEDPGAVDEYQWQTDYRHESLEDSPSLAIAISSQGAFWLPLATRAVLRKRPKVRRAFCHFCDEDRDRSSPDDSDPGHIASPVQTKYDMFHEYSEIRVTTKDVEENLADGNEEGSVPVVSVLLVVLPSEVELAGGESPGGTVTLNQVTLGPGPMIRSEIERT
ncbi:MAG: hypothetical protein BJ554DRAFT_6673 [Olpidium bornovanus]|uniref:Uncharacterized protein n=1 Tax=Olpidium bornovanus TaxID=278681 RepID=A0A8H7ZXG1_9FUNG|nr:MAG: hypothetical protein BJ554DRAFT_6673 [Olpidium bornovanus]